MHQVYTRKEKGQFHQSRCPHPVQHVQVQHLTPCACPGDSTAVSPKLDQHTWRHPAVDTTQIAGQGILSIIIHSVCSFPQERPQGCICCSIPALPGAANPQRMEEGWMAWPETEMSTIPAGGGLETNAFVS